MSLSALAVRRPVATTMVFVAITVIGLFAYRLLRVDLFPELDFPSISVVVTYPGVSPEEMETLITRPIEEAVARVEGIDRLESFSSEGRSRVALRFDWGVDLQTALNDVRAAVERARAQLPEDAEAPVVYKFDLASIPVVYMGLEADMDEASIRRFADEVVKPRFERIPGVASVDVRGARSRQVRIEIDPEALASYGLTVDDVAAALRAENLTVPAGRVEDGPENVLVRAMSEFETFDEIESARVATRGNVVIRVRDVAEIVDDFEDVSNIVRFNSQAGVQITVTKSPDANTIEVADAVYLEIERFNRDFEGQASLDITTDSSIFIRRSISSVQQSVLIGAGLAIFVLLLFLRSIRSTIIIAIAIPISVIATFLLMFQLDLTLNLITFGGLALGLGMLVDNAIVILENIYRRREAGDDAAEAAVRGSKEVSGAIVASTLTTLSVFAPVIFLGGFAAVFFSQMALVVSSSLLCSLLIALTLVPVLAGVLLRRGKGPTSLDAKAAARRPLENAYGRLVGAAVKHPIVTFLVAAGLLAAAVSQGDRVGSELLPESDESEVRIFAQYPAGTRIEVTTEAVERIERVIAENVPEATNVLATIGTPGFWSTSGEESCNLRINLVGVDERDRSSAEVAQALRPILEEAVPGMRLRVSPGSGLWIFNYLRGGDARVKVEIRGYDIETADALAAQIADIVTATEGIADSRPSRLPGGRELRLFVDREAAADRGLTTRDVADTISLLVQGRQVGVYRDLGDEYAVVLRLSDDDLTSTDRLLDSPVVLPGGGTTALRDLVIVESGRTPVAIDRLDQQRIVTVTGTPDDTRDLGSINEELRVRLRELDVPEGFTVIVSGEAEEQNDTFSSLMLGIVLAILLVYMVMAGQFESFIQPIIIMVAVPFAAIGVIGTLIVTDTTFNLNSFMGTVVLVGVVVNNAIVLVDYTNMMVREQGLDLTEAVIESARRRLRPILMTTLTTILALIPVAFGAGSGNETQAPLARVVIGGLLTSTLITLVLVPSLYSVVERIRAWLNTKLRPNDA